MTSLDNTQGQVIRSYDLQTLGANKKQNSGAAQCVCILPSFSNVCFDFRMFVKFCIGLKNEFLENRRRDGHYFRIGINKITFTRASCNCVILDTKERLGNVKSTPLSTPFLISHWDGVVAIAA